MVGPLHENVPSGRTASSATTDRRCAPHAAVHSAVRQAHDALLEFVRSAPVDTRLPPERELAVRFGVSRTTLRSAADRLARSGYLDVRRGSGYVTRRPGPEHLATPLAEALGDASSAKEVYAVRLLVEPQLAAVVARRTTPTTTASLRSAAAGRDADFHTLLASYAGNDVATLVVGMLVGLTAGSANAPLGSPDAAQLGGADAATLRRQHLAVVEAVADGDPDLARASLKLHLRWEARRLTNRSEP